MFNMTVVKGAKSMTTDITSPFELVEVSGERYGDIITFGIRVKDDENGTLDTIDLASCLLYAPTFWGCCRCPLRPHRTLR